MNSKEGVFMNLVLGTALVLLNLVLFNLLFDNMNGARVDMTEGQVYSLSSVTRSVIENLDEEVQITGYFSPAEKMHEKVRPLLAEITDLLEEYGALSDKVVLEIMAPEENEAEEEKALSTYGLSPQTFAFRDQGEQGVRSFYFGVVVRYAGAAPITINFPDMVRQGSVFEQEIKFTLKNVEFAITRAIKKSVFGFDGQRDVFARFPHKIHIKTYISTKDDLPDMFKESPDHTQSVLEQFAGNSGGKFTWEAIEVPKDDTGRIELERTMGISPLAFPLAKNSFYLWAMIELDGKPSSIMPLITADGALGEHELREQFESYFKRKTPGILRTIGLAQMQPAADPRAMQMGQRPPPAPFDILHQLLAESYQVSRVDLATLTRVPPEIDLLLVMAPENLSDKAVFAIDQHVMRGGSTIICVDRHRLDQNQMGGISAAAVTSGLEDTLAHWGVNIGDKMVLDNESGQFVFDRKVGGAAFGGRQRYRTEYIKWPVMPLVGRDPDAVNRDVGFLESFEELRFWMASALSTEAREGVAKTTLLQSSDRAWELPSGGPIEPDWTVDSKRGFIVPDEDACDRYELAVLLEGSFASWFADKPIPADEEPAQTEEDPKKEEADTTPIGAPLKKSPERTRMIVVGDASWVDSREYSWSGQLGYPFGYFEPNSVVLRNMIDWMLEDRDLITIRNRGRTLRPLRPLEEDERSSVQIWNFVAPLVLVVGLMVGVFTRRRNRQPLV